MQLKFRIREASKTPSLRLSRTIIPMLSSSHHPLSASRGKLDLRIACPPCFVGPASAPCSPKASHKLASAQAAKIRTETTGSATRFKIAWVSRCRSGTNGKVITTPVARQAADRTAGMESSEARTCIPTDQSRNPTLRLLSGRESSRRQT